MIIFKGPKNTNLALGTLGGAALLLLASSWFPLIEIKGFDTFELETISSIASRSVRITLGMVLLALIFRKIQIARWWLVFSVGILVIPLADRMKQSLDMLRMMDSAGTMDSGVMANSVVLLPGAWMCVAGLMAWMADALWMLWALFQEDCAGQRQTTVDNSAAS